MRTEANLPTGHRAHAWRVGMTPTDYAALKGPAAESTHAAVAEQLRADRTAFGVIPDRPAGARSHRARTRGPGSGHARTTARRPATRTPRSRKHLSRP
jgi:hypothetical protein